MHGACRDSPLLHLPQVEGSEAIAAVTTEQQREEFLKQLNDQEDWLYGDGEAAETVELKCAGLGQREGGDWRQGLGAAQASAGRAHQRTRLRLAVRLGSTFFNLLCARHSWWRQVALPAAAAGVGLLAEPRHGRRCLRAHSACPSSCGPSSGPTCAS